VLDVHFGNGIARRERVPTAPRLPPMLDDAGVRWRSGSASTNQLNLLVEPAVESRLHQRCAGVGEPAKDVGAMVRFVGERVLGGEALVWAVDVAERPLLVVLIVAVEQDDRPLKRRGEP
jgi:hypothetical protein